MRADALKNETLVDLRPFWGCFESSRDGHVTCGMSLQNDMCSVPSPYPTQNGITDLHRWRGGGPQRTRGECRQVKKVGPHQGLI